MHKGLAFLVVISLTALHWEIPAQELKKEAQWFSCSVEFCSAGKSSLPQGIFLPQLPGFANDIYYLDLSLKLNPASPYMEGRAGIYFRAKNKGDTLAFYLHDSLNVTEIKFRKGTLIPVRPGGHVLIIPLGSMVEAGERDSIRIDYKGVSGMLAGQKGLYTAIHNQRPYLWTLSEPYGAPTWWPSKLNLDDKIDSMQIAITHPSVYRSAANGLLVHEKREDSLATTLWKHRYPIVPYLIAVAVGEYTVYEEQINTSSGTIPVLNFAYPTDSDMVRQATGALEPIYRLYDTLFGPYPFMQERYGHLQCPMGGGMEHQTLTFAGPFSHHVLSHELAHSWFGNKVTTGSWKDIWLNEGFATYATGLTYQYLFDGVYWKPWKKETIAAVCSQPGGSVYVKDTTSLMRIFDARLSYHKAAMLLHMLRWKVGDTFFFDALRTYLGFPGLSYGFARTYDFINIMEGISGQSLTGFMNQWFFGEGYPTYTLKWSMKTTDTIQIILFQQTSHPSVNFFDIPIEVVAKNSTHDTSIVLNPEYNGQKFNIPIHFIPDSIIFDPELRIISSANQVLGIAGPSDHDQDLSLVPNPSKDYFLIQGKSEKALITIHDVKGVMMLSKKVFLPCEVSVAGLRPGLYFVTIETPQKNQRRKLIVQ